MKNTQLAQTTGQINLLLTNDQIVTLSDLLSDQVCIQRVRLRDTLLTVSYIGSLTHLRHLRSLIYNKVRGLYTQEEENAQEAGDIELAQILRTR